MVYNRTIDYSLVREQKHLRAFSLLWASEKFKAKLIPCQCVISLLSYSFVKAELKLKKGIQLERSASWRFRLE